MPLVDSNVKEMSQKLETTFKYFNWIVSVQMSQPQYCKRGRISEMSKVAQRTMSVGQLEDSAI